MINNEITVISRIRTKLCYTLMISLFKLVYNNTVIVIIYTIQSLWTYNKMTTSILTTIVTLWTWYLVNQDQCLFSYVYVTSNCVDLITKQKINNWLVYSAMQHEHCDSHRYCEAERESCILICAIYNCVRCCMAEDTVRTQGSVNTDSFTTTHCIHGVNPNCFKYIK